MAYIKEKIDIFQWLPMTRNGVLNKFHSVPNAFSDGRKQERFVYIAGTRPDKVLIVAHADTVWNEKPINFEFTNGKIKSTNKGEVEEKIVNGTKSVSRSGGVGIGADDRAGCSIAWEMIDSGHSILITSGEEIGCIATRRIIRSDWWKEEIAKHQFAVQFDRRNSNDIVFYDVGTNDFVDYVHDETKYQPESGSTTDIKHLCMDICGVNMSVGYYREHTPDENLVLEEYNRTLEVAQNWLNKSSLPRFEKAKSKKDEFFYYGSKYAPSYNQSYQNDQRYCDSNDGGWGEYQKNYNLGRPEAVGNTEIIHLKSEEEIVDGVVCTYCGVVSLQENWFNNYFCCVHCYKEI